MLSSNRSERRSRTICVLRDATHPLPVVTQATIRRFRRLIRTLNYFVSTHAAEELEDDNLSILDLENIVLTGQITERQRDARTGEVKCVISGVTLDGSIAEAVVKVGFTGKLIVITVYAC